MIPKKIHYCWFGGKDLPRSVRKCINSWRKLLPDFEIIRWDETNFDLNSNRYAAEAYSAGNYAFVSDVARLKALTEHGGVYFDTDVEVVKDFTPLLVHDAILCFEGTQHIATSTMGCEAHHPLFEEFYEAYCNAKLHKPDGTIDTNTNVVRLTALLMRHGLKQDGTMQKIAGATILPNEYFSPYDYIDGRLRATENTYSIHWYSQSWLGISGLRRFVSQIYHRLRGIKLK